MVAYKRRFGMPLHMADLADEAYGRAQPQQRSKVGLTRSVSGDSVSAAAGAAVQAARAAAAAASASDSLTAAQAARAAAHEAMRAADEARASAYYPTPEPPSWQPLEHIPSWVVLPARHYGADGS